MGSSPVSHGFESRIPWDRVPVSQGHGFEYRSSLNCFQFAFSTALVESTLGRSQFHSKRSFSANSTMLFVFLFFFEIIPEIRELLPNLVPRARAFQVSGDRTLMDSGTIHNRKHGFELPVCVRMRAHACASMH